MDEPTATVPARPELTADCERCFGLCCVALPFSASADFPVDKAAGDPCPNLDAAFRCGIHRTLRQVGFVGCTVYECFGAGQRLSQHTFGGVDWRTAPDTAPTMFAALPVMRQLHELLAYVHEAIGLDVPDPLRTRLRDAAEAVDRAAAVDAASLVALDVDALRRPANELLLDASRHVRTALRTDAADHRGADLFGARRRGADFRAASLRGAVLVGADLRDADLRDADVIGCDLRGADLRGADLRGALFLTQSQLDAARGDDRTRLPAARRRPAHW